MHSTTTGSTIDDGSSGETTTRISDERTYSVDGLWMRDLYLQAIDVTLIINESFVHYVSRNVCVFARHIVQRNTRTCFIIVSNAIATVTLSLHN